MTLVAHFADAAGRTHGARFVAAGAERTAFARWVDGLPAEGHGALKQLREWGYVWDLSALEGQLRRALAGGEVDPGVRTVGRRLLDLLAGRGDAACLLVGPPG